MNGFAGFLSRSLRGVRLVEFGALLVLLVMVLGVYLAKASAGRERGDITSIQSQIDEDSKRLRLLQAEVAHLEEPARLGRLADELGLGPAQHEATADQLASIRSALHQVTTAPNGTAAGFSVAKPFAGDTHNIAGKTGTAESSQEEPHAWFAAFSPTDGAKLASVAMVEHGGEGGDVAAPIVRKVIDAYYNANP